MHYVATDSINNKTYKILTHETENKKNIHNEKNIS